MSACEDLARRAAEAFEQAALALTAVVTHAQVEPNSVEVRCEAPDLELLFVEWLNAVIYEMAVRQDVVRALCGENRGHASRKQRCGASRSTSRGMRPRASRKAPPTRR